MSIYTCTGLTAAILLCGAAASPAMATVSFPSRTSLSQIDSSRSDFSDATLTIAATTQVGAGSTGSRTIDFSGFPTLASYSGSSTGPVNLTDTGFEAPAEIRARVEATGPGGGSFTYLERYGADTDPYGYGPLYRYSGATALPSGDPFFPSFTHTNVPLLEVFLPIIGAGLVDEKGSFRIGVSVPGNYSETDGLASSSGQHYLNHLDSAWATDQDFIYDAATNRTTFSAVNASYRYASSGHAEDDPSPALDVYFFGRTIAPVPEPGAWLAVLLGLGFVAVWKRRLGRREWRTAEPSRRLFQHRLRPMLEPRSGRGSSP